MSNSLKYTLFIMFAIIFSIFGALGGINYFGDLRAQKIAQTGTEAIATVHNGYSEQTVNGVDYYYLVFTFTDENGVEHYGETNSAYTYAEGDGKRARNARQPSYLEVRYAH